MHHIKFRYWWG